jgi:hypothetical protein
LKESQVKPFLFDMVSYGFWFEGIALLHRFLGFEGKMAERQRRGVPVAF